MVVNLSEKNSILGDWISELRGISTQGDRLRFRRNLERIGEIAAYEISRQLEYQTSVVQTPLGSATCRVLAVQPVLATILRAGLPLHQGLLNYFDRADNAFISAYRKHHSGGFDISLEYISCPYLCGRVLILSDPMLATGASLVKALDFLLGNGQPIDIHIVVAIACTPGIERLLREREKVHIWAGAIDKELTPGGYIVPGLGDAGDLAYGVKLQQ